MATRLKLDPPRCNCLLLCDDVLESKGRGRHFLHGVIGRIAVAQLPAAFGPTVAYVRLHGLQEGQKMQIRFDHLETSDTRLDIGFEIGGKPDPDDVHTVMVPIPPLAVEHAGRYVLSVLHDETVILFTPIDVEVAGGRGKGPSDGNEPDNT